MIYSDNSFTHIITRTSSRYRNILSQQMSSQGLGHITPDYRIILEVLWKEDNIGIGALATRASKDNASLTRIIDGMERNDLVQRIKSSTDGRASLIVLTSYAISIKERVEEVEQIVFERATSGLNPIEVKELERILLSLIHI